MFCFDLNLWLLNGKCGALKQTDAGSAWEKWFQNNLNAWNCALRSINLSLKLPVCDSARTRKHAVLLLLNKRCPSFCRCQWAMFACNATCCKHQIQKERILPTKLRSSFSMHSHNVLEPCHAYLRQHSMSYSHSWPVASLTQGCLSLFICFGHIKKGKKSMPVVEKETEWYMHSEWKGRIIPFMWAWKTKSIHALYKLKQRTKGFGCTCLFGSCHLTILDVSFLVSHTFTWLTDSYCQQWSQCWFDPKPQSEKIEKQEERQIPHLLWIINNGNGLIADAYGTLLWILSVSFMIEISFVAAQIWCPLL